MIERRCPRCGAEYNADTSEFIPVKAEDGTYEPTKDWVHHPQACVDFIGNQLARAKERIAELESIVELDQRQNEWRLDAITSVLERVGDHKHLRDADGQSVYMVWEFCRMWELLEESLERGGER